MARADLRAVAPLRRRRRCPARAISAPAAVLLLALTMLAAPAGSAAAAVRGTISAGAANGFARILFEFEKPVEQKTTLANSVLVITFGTAVDIDPSTLAESIPAYVAAARLDPDRTTLRFALGASYTANTIVARDRIYIDLLPENWTGPPPGLPQEVVAELIRLAEEEAARAARRENGEEEGAGTLQVQVGRYPTFSRVVFEWSRPTNTVLSRDGDSVVLSFDRASEVDLSRLNNDPPPQLTSATARHGEDRLAITLVVDPGTDVRGFREASTYVVDLAIDTPDPTLTGDPLFDAAGLAADAAADGVTTMPAPVDRPASQDDGASAAEDLVSITVTPLELSTKSDGLVEIGAEADPGADFGLVSDDAGGAGAPDDAAGGEEGAVAAVAEPGSGDGGGAGEMSPPAADPAAPVEVETRIVGTTLRLKFPFVEAVASAAFQRAGTLWVVFDSGAPLITDTLRSDSNGLVREVSLVSADGVQILRLELSGRFLATSGMDGTSWIVSVGDLVLGPTEPLPVERALREDGTARVTVPLAGAGRVHWISDDVIGDQLAIVTAHGPARGLIKRQEFVEFTALATAHGIAVRPLADDLAVRLIQDEVVVTRARGLNISAGKWPQDVVTGGSFASAARPGFVDFEHWRGNEGLLLRRKAQTLLNELASLPLGERANHRLALVRLYLAHELGIEALGVMTLAEEEDGDVVNDVEFRAMRGIARVMASRFAGAGADLNSLGLDRSPHIALWRSLVAAAEGAWEDVLALREEGRDALDAYPIVHRARFLLAGAEAGLETHRLDVTARDLDALAGVELGEHDAARRGLLRARLAEAYGNSDEAMALYQDLAVSPVRPVAARAELRRITSFLRAGRMTRQAAIDALESVSVIWRGDSTELTALRKLAGLYAEEGSYRAALETMKTAVVNHVPSQLVRLIGDDMSQLFNRLFLEGHADDLEPISALGLYYDFRELTPVGRRGDEMIRRLAHRLVEVDLLDQAADLLEHQVSNRLTGVARAQVATDLSLIHLMARKPELALRAIHQTRQAVLPQELQERRNVLEARALAELGRVEVAVDILNAMSGPDVEHQKADALWRGQRWQQAGEQIERMLGDRWQDPAELGEAERLDVLRAAIAYALGEDAIGIERLRRKYTAKMASSPDASSFEVVTGSARPDTKAISDLSREIAAVDTLETFLGEFRARYGKFSPAVTTDAAAPDTGS